MLVYVISKTGQPLMPTTRFGKVRRLLKENKAKVLSRCPFIIKLLYNLEKPVIQECILGQDTGSKNIGTAIYSNGKILYQSQIKLRDDIKDKMSQRRKYRRNRRSRKTRYRKARFLNRGNSIKENRLNPTLKSKIDSNIK